MSRLRSVFGFLLAGLAALGLSRCSTAAEPRCGRWPSGWGRDGGPPGAVAAVADRRGGRADGRRGPAGAASARRCGRGRRGHPAALAIPAAGPPPGRLARSGPVRRRGTGVRAPVVAADPSGAVLPDDAGPPSVRGAPGTRPPPGDRRRDGSGDAHVLRDPLAHDEQHAPAAPGVGGPGPSGGPPEAYSASPVYPSVGASEAAVRSPVLDRIGVRYVVVPPTVRIFGRREVVSVPEAGTVVLPAGETLSASLRGGAVRAVMVHLASVPDVGRAALLTARFLDPVGTFLSQGSRLLHRGLVLGPIDVPVVEPCAEGADCPPQLLLELRLEAPGGRALLQAGEGGGPALTAVMGTDDGLRIEVVENVVGYRRLGSLPRIRWSSSAVVVEDPGERIRPRRRDGSNRPRSCSVPPGPPARAVGRGSGSGSWRTRGIASWRRSRPGGPDTLWWPTRWRMGGGPRSTVGPASFAPPTTPASPCSSREDRIGWSSGTHPPGWRPGLAISLASLVSLGVGVALVRRRRSPLPEDVGEGSVPGP